MFLAASWVGWMESLQPRMYVLYQMVLFPNHPLFDILYRLSYSVVSGDRDFKVW